MWPCIVGCMVVYVSKETSAFGTWVTPHPSNDTMSHDRRHVSSATLLWELSISWNKTYVVNTLNTWHCYDLFPRAVPWQAMSSLVLLCRQLHRRYRAVRSTQCLLVLTFAQDTASRCVLHYRFRTDRFMCLLHKVHRIRHLLSHNLQRMSKSHILFLSLLRVSKT